MVGLRRQDINKDVLMMFALSYEYSLSFTNLLKLFKISKQYFWTFMEICSPMLKMGIRKASMLRKSVEKIYPYITGEGEQEALNPREDAMLEKFRWFIEDYFSDGDGCLSVEQLEAVPSARGYTEKDVCVTYDYPSLRDNLDRVKYIKIGDNKFFKTSKALYYMEKYCGDLDFYQINNLSVKDIIKKVYMGEEELREKELGTKYVTREKV